VEYLACGRTQEYHAGNRKDTKQTREGILTGRTIVAPVRFDQRLNDTA
jgi:hypothetical protein